MFAELEASGRFLWDDQPDYPYAEFLRHQHEVQPPRVWASLFMNRPSPIEGSFFKAAWLKTFHNPPPCETLKTYIAVDVTVTDSAKADQMVIAVFALDPAYIFVLDLWRHQAGAATSVDVLLDMARDWKPIVIVTESGQLKNALFLFP